MRFTDWCYLKHRETNHMYAGYLPYEFHLRLTVKTAKDFLFLPLNVEAQVLIDACAGHDLIEDARQSYHDVIVGLETCDQQWNNRYAVMIADTIYAVSNEKGKNRRQRANEKYYAGIRETRYAKFVKMCDKIANVKYSALMADKLQMHKDEHEYFLSQMQLEPLYQPMLTVLEQLLNQQL